MQVLLIATTCSGPHLCSTTAVCCLQVGAYYLLMQGKVI